jgi:long-chain acyl-CoA synthetase
MLRVVTDDRPQDVLAALEDAEPVAVVDRAAVDAVTPVPLHACEQHLPPGTWLVALTSGTTAAPRAVCRSRASWEASVAHLAELTGTRAGQRVLVPGPLSSTLFLYAAWHAGQVGAEPVLADPTGSWAQIAWDVAHLVPHQLARLVDDPDVELDGRTVVVAGAALPTRLAERARRRGLRVIAYYGAAELSFVAAGTPEALRAFPDAHVEVRDGEIWVRSPYLALDYLTPCSHASDASGSSSPSGSSGPSGPWRRDGGWSTVGDRGLIGADGSIVVHGRGDTAVQTGGATVHVADAEHVLRAHPEVGDVVVTGIPHRELGQVVAAVVESATASVPELRRWAQAMLPSHSRPRRWAVVDHLPRTESGKVDRAAVAPLLRRGGGHG